jgi:GTPase
MVQGTGSMDQGIGFTYTWIKAYTGFLNRGIGSTYGSRTLGSRGEHILSGSQMELKKQREAEEKQKVLDEEQKLERRIREQQVTML